MGSSDNWELRSHALFFYCYYVCIICVIMLGKLIYINFFDLRIIGSLVIGKLFDKEIFWHGFERRLTVFFYKSDFRCVLWKTNNNGKTTNGNRANATATRQMWSSFAATIEHDLNSLIDCQKQDFTYCELFVRFLVGDYEDEFWNLRTVQLILNCMR